MQICQKIRWCSAKFAAQVFKSKLGNTKIKFFHKLSSLSSEQAWGVGGTNWLICDLYLLCEPTNKCVYISLKPIIKSILAHYFWSYVQEKLPCAFNMLLDLNRRWICNINVQDHNCYINGCPTPMVESRQFSFMDEYCISGFCKKNTTICRK